MASMERQRKAIDERGWGLWAVELDGVFAGFTGLNTLDFSAIFTPCVEIGCRFHQVIGLEGWQSLRLRWLCDMDSIP